jgi:hypothetical protein
MTAKKHASRRSSGSDLKRVDAHVIQRREYDELPKLTEDMLARGKVNKGRQAPNVPVSIQSPIKSKNN